MTWSWYETTHSQHEMTFSWYKMTCSQHKIICSRHKITYSWHKMTCNWYEMTYSRHKMTCSWHEKTHSQNKITCSQFYNKNCQPFIISWLVVNVLRSWLLDFIILGRIIIIPKVVWIMKHILHTVFFGGVQK